MNLLKSPFHIKKGNFSVFRDDTGMIIENKSSSLGILILPRIIFSGKNKGKEIKVSFEGSILTGTSAQFKLVNKKRKIIFEAELNTISYFDKVTRASMPSIAIMPHTKVRISSINLEFGTSFFDEIKETFTGNILLMAPGYPTLRNKYGHGFIHTRVKAYQNLNWNFNVTVVHEEKYTQFYSFEGVTVCKTSYYNMRRILQDKKYDKILIHFFSEKFSQILDGSDTSKTKIYLYSHGGDMIYRDINKMIAPYFEQPKEFELYQENHFKKFDKIVEKYNEKKNVKWIFVTPWAQKRSEETNNIKYKNSIAIPCLIDEKQFKFIKKKPDLRKKIFILRKFDNVNTYSIDIDVRVILELSRRPFFKDLEFNIYGEGSEQERLLAPIKDFDNINIYKYFLTHEEMANAHAKNGIALFATRYDTQGVSACEAAMSGLVVISSVNPGVQQVINPELDTLCDTENYIQYADKIEELYNDENKFLELSQQMHDFVVSKCGYEHTIQKELNMFEDEIKVNILPPFKEPAPDNEIILTIAIPSYNVEKFIRNTVYSLINHKEAHKIEILIISDGSTDNTVTIGQELVDLTTVNSRSIVKLINKENGGHGSTINTGIELAKGKYFKLLDGDDYFDTKALEKLINYLENETSDLVLNNYVEDWTITTTMNSVRHYEFMNPGWQYQVEQLTYPSYGFTTWGPLLSTSTFRTKMLQDAGFKISEHCFYVDMELNFFAFIETQTITYYPLDLYIYQLGSPFQSVSKESFKRNYKHHEKITLRIVNQFYNRKHTISSEKRKYLFNFIIVPLVEGQYFLTTEYFNTKKPFMDFDRELKRHPEIYNDSRVLKKRITLLRKTNGRFFKVISALSKLRQFLKRK